MKLFENNKAYYASTEEEALKALESLPDTDKAKVLEYIQSLVEFAKEHEDNKQILLAKDSILH